MGAPYRPEGPPRNDELARLAQQGQQRIALATEGRQVQAQQESNYHLRVAVGSVRGSPLRRSFLFLGAAGLLLVAVGIAASIDVIFDRSLTACIGLGFMLAMGGFMTFLFVAPRATNAQVQAERAYVAALPFVLDGYFDVLSQEPRSSVQLQIDLDWRTTGTDGATLQGVLGLLDTGARVTATHPASASITTGSINGFTGIRVNRVPVYRNHKLARYLRDLIGKVLLPLDRNVGIARVRVTRSSGW